MSNRKSFDLIRPNWPAKPWNQKERERERKPPPIRKSVDWASFAGRQATSADFSCPESTRAAERRNQPPPSPPSRLPASTQREHVFFHRGEREKRHITYIYIYIIGEKNLYYIYLYKKSDTHTHTHIYCWREKFSEKFYEMKKREYGIRVGKRRGMRGRGVCNYRHSSDPRAIYASLTR